MSGSVARARSDGLGGLPSRCLSDQEPCNRSRSLGGGVASTGGMIVPGELLTGGVTTGTPIAGTGMSVRGGSDGASGTRAGAGGGSGPAAGATVGGSEALILSRPGLISSSLIFGTTGGDSAAVVVGVVSTSGFQFFEARL